MLGDETRTGTAPEGLAELSQFATRAERGAPSNRPTRPSAPERIGRFTILRELGEGAMGIVYAAYDEQLDRKVAVKVVRGEALRRDPNLRDRMLREAKAMARVSHPNIVTVHDVGTHAGEVWIAMEFLRGLSLIDWLQARACSWQEVVGVFLQAGRGLAAAHQGGVVHRDFKPANILVSDEGVVKVLDFGLARSVQPRSGPVYAAKVRDESGPYEAAASASGLYITRPGTILGTPAYMSPEHQLGQPTTPLSDQFSFCVALWEALYAEPPFDRSSLPALKAAVIEGRLREPPLRTEVPGKILPILRRGLSLAPERRFATMPELLTALERCLVRSRQTLAVLAGLVVTITAGGVMNTASGHEDPCAAAGREIVGLWDEPTAAAVRDGLLATRVSYAEDTWNLVEPRIGAYARSLAEMRVDACRAHEEGRASTHLFDLRTACLDQRHAGVATLVKILRDADVEVVRNAASAAATLPSLASCHPTQLLSESAAMASTPEQAVRVGEIRTALAEAQAHELAGQFTRGLEIVDGIDTRGLDHPPVLAEIGLRRGNLLTELGRHEDADALLSEALRTALASDHDRAAAELATRREFVRAARLLRAQDVLDDAPIVEGLVARIDTHGEEGGLRGDHLNNLGIAHAVLGQVQLAAREFVASIDARTAALGAEHPQVVYGLGNLGLLLISGDDIVEATRRLSAAFLAAETTLGPRHPHVALLAINLGIGHVALGRHHDAEADFAHALALQAETLGPDAPDLHFVLEAIGDLAISRRRCDEAGGIL